MHVPLFTGVTARESDIDLAAYEEAVLRHHAPVLNELLSDIDSLVRAVLHFCTSKITNLSPSLGAIRLSLSQRHKRPSRSQAPNMEISLRRYTDPNFPPMLPISNLHRHSTENFT